MGIFRRKTTDAEDNDALIKKYLVSVVNVPASPPESPERDTGLGLDIVRQRAEVDASSGGWDHFATIALNAQFPTEEYIDHEIQRRRNEHRNTKRNREIAGAHLLEDAETLAVSIDGRTTSLATVEGRVRELKEDLKDLEEIRDDHLAIVEGKKTDEDRTPWTGPAPTAPVIDSSSRFLQIKLALRPDRVKQWFLDIGLTLAALMVETIIVKESIELLIRDQGWFGYLYALPPLLVATVLPHVIGTRLAATVRRGTATMQEKAVYAVALPVWLLTVYFLARVRTDATEHNARVAIARGSRGAYTPESVPQDVLEQQFRPFATLALWFCLIIAVGVSLLVLKLAFYNPYISKLVKDYSKIVVAEVNLSRAQRERERITGQIEVQKKSLETVLDSWDHYINVILPAHALELKAHYRNCLINKYGDPEMTGAILAVPESNSYAFAEPPKTEVGVTT